MNVKNKGIKEKLGRCENENEMLENKNNNENTEKIQFSLIIHFYLLFVE
jgi:hypothetical protein